MAHNKNFFRQKKGLFATLIVFAFLLAIIAISGCTTNGQNSSGLVVASDVGQAQKLKIGIQASPSTTLVIVADEKGFFKDENLNIELVEFSAGKFAFQAFLAKQLDFAAFGDVPVVLALINGNNDFYVLSQILEKNLENRVVVLTDGTAANPKDYFTAKKRKLSTINGGTAEFYTYNFLKYYGIDQNQVEIIFQKPEDIPISLSTKSVDAISDFEPYPYLAEQNLLGQTTSFTIPPEVYSPLYVVVADKEWTDKNPDAAASFLKALKSAEEFVKKNPGESQKIVAKRTRFSEDAIKAIWSAYGVKVTLTDELMRNWNAEAKWAIETGKTKSTEIPDFEKILKREILEAANGDSNK